MRVQDMGLTIVYGVLLLAFLLGPSARATLPNYLAEATEASEGQRLLWRRDQNPITVAIVYADAAQREFLPEIQKSLLAWETALDGRVRFRLIDRSDKANILIRLVEAPIAPDDGVAGETGYEMPADQFYRRQMKFLQLTLNTGDAAARSRLDPPALHARMARMALHEMGHAMGIWGHSPYAEDIMYAHPRVSQLSERDIQTVRQLYGL